MRKREFDKINKPLFITASLIDSVNFHVNMPPENKWKKKSLDQLKTTLKRKDVFIQNEFTKRGQDFENKIVAFSRSDIVSFREVFEKDVFCSVKKLDAFYYALQGEVQTQKTMKGKFEVDEQPFTFYGVADIVQGYPPVKHVDIKTTSKWETGKYSSERNYKTRAQHLMYMYLDKVKEFEYLIAEFQNAGNDERPEWLVVDVHSIEIKETDYKRLEKKIFNKVLDTVNFISQDEEMWNDYCNIFTRSW